MARLSQSILPRSGAVPVQNPGVGVAPLQNVIRNPGSSGARISPGVASLVSRAAVEVARQGNNVLLDNLVRQQRLEREADFTGRISRARKNFQDLKTQLSDEPLDKFDSRVGDAVAAINRDALGGSVDDRDIARLQGRLDGMGLDLLASASTIKTRRTKDLNLANLQNNLQTIQEDVLSVPFGPDAHATAQAGIAEAKRLFQGAVESTALTATQGAKQFLDFKRKLEVDRVRNDVRRAIENKNPEQIVTIIDNLKPEPRLGLSQGGGEPLDENATLKKIVALENQGKTREAKALEDRLNADKQNLVSGTYGLDELRASQLRAEALRTFNSIRGKQETVDDKQRKLGQDSTFESLLLNPDQVTTQKLEELRGTRGVTASQFQTLVRLNESQKKEKSDPDSFDDIANRIAFRQGTPAELRKSLQVSVATGQVTGEDARPLAEKINRYQKELAGGNRKTESQALREVGKLFEARISTVGPLAQFTKPREKTLIQTLKTLTRIRVDGGENPFVVANDLLSRVDKGEFRFDQKTIEEIRQKAMDNPASLTDLEITKLLQDKFQNRRTSSTTNSAVSTGQSGQTTKKQISSLENQRGDSGGSILGKVAGVLTGQTSVQEAVTGQPQTPENLTAKKKIEQAKPAQPTTGTVEAISSPTEQNQPAPVQPKTTAQPEITDRQIQQQDQAVRDSLSRLPDNQLQDILDKTAKSESMPIIENRRRIVQDILDQRRAVKDEVSVVSDITLGELLPEERSIFDFVANGLVAARDGTKVSQVIEQIISGIQSGAIAGDRLTQLVNDLTTLQKSIDAGALADLFPRGLEEIIRLAKSREAVQ